MENNKQHVQVPNDMTSTHIIAPKDLLIYTAIKRYSNKDGVAYPSLKRIADDSGASINTVRKSISLLEKEGYIEIDKTKKNNVYYCKKYNNFEPFSYEFLDRKDLTFTDKAFFIASQQYMYKDNNDGKISMSLNELSDLINMPESTISRCNKNLQDKGYLTVLDTQAKDSETGCLKKEKVYHLDKLGQTVVFLLKEHNKQINQNTEDIDSLKKDMDILKSNYEKVCKELEKQNKLVM